MSMINVAAAGAAGIFTPGAIGASTCTQVSSSAATFNIPGIDATRNTYTTAVVSGSVTPTLNTSTKNISISGSGNFEVSITPRSIKGNILGQSIKINGRAQITTYTVTSQGACTNFAYDPGCLSGCPGGSCDGPGCCYSYQQIVNTYENSPPSGYSRIDLGQGAWWVRL